MSENKMKEVAKLLGVKFGEEFEIKGIMTNPYHFSELGLVDKFGSYANNVLANLLNGELEIEKPILNEVEKRYLEGVFRPFKDRIEFITKHYTLYYGCYISVILENDCFRLPCFKKSSMYINMETDKDYTLEELGLFKED